MLPSPPLPQFLTWLSLTPKLLVPRLASTATLAPLLAFPHPTLWWRLAQRQR
jgi:hypothetical protein